MWQLALLHTMREYQHPQMLTSNLESIAIIETIGIHVDIHTSATADTSLNLGQIRRAAILASTATAANVWD